MCDINTKENTKLPLIGDVAPSFEALTTTGKIKFPEDFKSKWVILFSHPADFTPVCTTEFVIFQSMLKEFQSLNTEIIGLSIDSIHSHLAWLETIKEKIEFNGIKKQEITFPLIADIKMEIAKLYGMIQPNASDTKAVRAVFFIDPNSIVRTILYYPLNIGRNFDEIKRILIALQLSDKENISTPANWNVGKDVVIPSPITINGLNKRLNDKSLQCKDWFLCFKSLDEN